MSEVVESVPSSGRTTETEESTKSEPSEAGTKTEGGWQPSAEQVAELNRQRRSITRDMEREAESANERLRNLQEYNGHLGMGQTVESGISVSGEKEYLTPTGDRTTNKVVADAISGEYRRQVADMSVGGQLGKAYKRVSELRGKAEKRRLEIIESWEKDVRGKYGEDKGWWENIKSAFRDALAQNSHPYASEAQVKIESDPEYRALQAAIHQTEEQIGVLERERDRKEGIDVGFWRGFGDIAGKMKTWDFGYSDLMDMSTMLNANREGGNERASVREAEQEMLRSAFENEQSQQQYGENDDFWYRAGTMTGHMPAFIKDFVLTGGGYSTFNLIGKGAGKLATKAVGKEVVEDMAKEGFKTYVKKHGLKGFGQEAANWTIKALGTTADDLLVRAPMMTNTIQIGQTTADIIDRKLGDVVVKEDGTYDFSNNKSWSSAIWQGEANSIIENFSEMFGAHLDPVVTFGNMSKLANVVGAKRLGAVLSKADAGALSGIMGQTHQLFNKMGVSDYFGEVTEEYYGQMWRTMLNLDDAYQQNPDGTRTNLLATGQFHGDIWGGMALSMGLMGAGKHTLSAAHYTSMKHSVNKADARVAELLGKDVWEPMRVMIDLATNEDMGAMAEIIITDHDFTEEEKASVLTYMERTMMMRGFNLATFAQSRSEQDNDVQTMNESYIDGYSIESSQEMNDAKNMYDYQRSRVIEALGEDVAHEIEKERENALSRLGEDAEVNDIVLDYLNAQMVYDGMIQRVRDDIDGRVAQSNAMVNARTNRTTGMIQGATMKQDDRRVYVINGNLVQYADGSGIDIEASDNSIIVRDAETGALEQVSPDAILNIDEALDPITEMRTAADAIRQQYAQEAADKIDGVVTFNGGEIYRVRLAEGSADLEVVANADGVIDNGDGTVNVSDGINVYPISKEIIQESLDAQNRLRVAEFEQQRAAENTAYQQGIEEANGRDYAVSDKVRLRDASGNVIHGEISDYNEVEDEFVLDVDYPINGKYVVSISRSEMESMIEEHNGNSVSSEKNNDIEYSKTEDELLTLQKGDEEDELSERISQENNGSRAERIGSPEGKIQDAAIRCQESRRSYEESRSGSEQVRAKRSWQEVEARDIEEYAKESGLWLDYIDDVMHLGEPGASGNENDTYISGDGESIYKVNNLMNSKDITSLLEKITLHNEYFPLTAYELTGFTGFGRSSVYPVLRQQYVDNATFATVEEIDEYMRSLGFEQTGEAAYSNSDVTISDLRPRNVLKSAGGTIYVVDAEFRRHERSESGTQSDENDTRTAMERVPKDAQGNPVYEQTDSDTAWDAIVEQTEGDEAMAQTVADGMVADKEAALKKLEKAKSKGGATIAEKIAAEKERKAAIDAAQQELNIWKKIAGTANRRRMDAEAERRRVAEEAAALRKAEEAERLGARLEAERIEREALNGVPDMVDDTPQDARARGYRRVSGHKIDRQEPVQGLQGKEVAVRFSDDAIANGRVAVIEANQLQPSHVQGQRNPFHFIDEAQPKERNDEASVMSARKIAGNIRPEEITSSVTAYTGAPTVNARGEAIQGNNRSDALRQMWEGYQDQAAKYKQYLIDHAEEFGLNADEVAAMEQPVLVNMLDVEDAEAITLGQYVAQDTESGGTERIKPKNALQKMGNDMRSFANLLLKSNDEDTSFAGLVDANGVEVLKWMSGRGYITPTQYKSAFDSKGNLTAEAKNDLRGIMYQSIFKGGSTRLEEMFNAMPAKAQKAILATAFRDYDSPNAERMIVEIQNSIRAFYALSQSEDFVNAKTFKDARMAVESWKIQYQIDDVTGESYLPAENFSNFALHLATMYKGENQSIIQGTFNKLYDLIQGTQEPNLFEQPDNTPRTLAQAIYETLNITYDGQQRSNVLVGDSSASQRGQQGSTGDAATGERVENGERTADSAGSIDGDSRGIRIEGENRSHQSEETHIPQTEEVIGRSLSADEAENFIADMEENADTAPDIELTIENWDALFGEEGTVATPIGEVKMGESQFTKLMRTDRNGKLGMIKPTLENPHAIVEDTSEAKGDNVTERASSYVFIRSFKKADGSRYYYFTSVTVSKDGKEVVISNQEKSKKRISNLLQNGVISWINKNVQSVSEAQNEESVLLDDSQAATQADNNTASLGINSSELSESKDTTISPNTNELGEKSVVPSIQEQVQAAEAEYKTVKTTEGQSNWANKSNETNRADKTTREEIATISQESEQVSDQEPEKATLIEVVRTVYTKGKEVASKLFSMKFFDVAQTPKFMQELGLRGDKFTIKYGVIARHLGKDSSHTLTERDWEQLPQALQNPFAISKLTDKDNSYRIYTTLQTEGGEFVVVGADVKNAGHEIEVNAISTVFGRRNNANLPKNEEVIYRSKEITPEQSSLLKRPNFAQYPTVQELSEGKDTTNPPTTTEIGEKKAEKVEKESKGTNASKEGATYSISPAQYTTKKGKVLDMHLVKFTGTLTKEQQRAAKELAKADKGWYDRERGGFMMRSEESAKQLADTIISDEEAVSDAQPVSMTDIQAFNNGDVLFTEPQQPKEQPKDDEYHPVWQYSIHVDADGYTTISRDDVSSGYPIGDARFRYSTDSPEEMLDILRNPLNGMQEVLEAVGVTLENKINTRELDRKIKEEREQKRAELRANGVNGYKIGDEVMYKGKKAKIHDLEEFGEHRPVLDTGLGPVMYEVTEWSTIKKPQQNQSASSQNGQDLTTGSSIDNGAVTGTKVTINPYAAKHELNNLVHKYAGVRKTRGFISDLTSALGDREAKQTYYFEFKDKAGNAYTLRISNHNVNGENIGENEKEISIVIKSRRQPNKFVPGNVDVKEYVYFKESIANGDGQTLAWIAQDIATMLDTGVYADNSGIAVINEGVKDGSVHPQQVNVESLFNALNTKGETKLSNHVELQPATNPSGNRLVTDERYAELRERMRKKLGGQMNIGIDPEILAIGTEMAVYHLEKGARKFTEYAKAMIADLGDVIRPYLKAFYNGARELPEVVENGLASDMTSYDEVRTFDVANFDKPGIDAFATAETVTREAEVAQEVEIAQERIKKTRSVRKQSEKKAVTLQQSGELGLFDELFAEINNKSDNEDGLQRTDAVRSEGVSANGNRDSSRGSRTTNSEEVRQGSERTKRIGESGSREIGGSVQQSNERSDGRIQRITEPKNTRNNHSERGKEHAPTSVDARIEANIKAIELAKQLLESGEQATEKQMQTLRKFSGWGGLGKAFSEGTYYAPNHIAKRLRELLGEAAYQEAVMSANSAYYTPAYVVDTLWDIAQQMGFEGGYILEGSAGIGNILGQMPTHISERSDIHAIEIDGTSGGILSLLYPDAKVEIQGFEQTRIANGSVDLAITNVPFVTGLRVNDTTGDKDLSKKFHNIHDFCIAKNVRKLREGGLGIFITSNGTLDNSKKLRDWIVNEGGADFVGAFRMHNKTFGGTGVTSDIIVIRKRVNGKKSANAIDVSNVSGERVAEYDTGETRKNKGQIVPVVKQLSMDYNQYFIEHPENMAGEMHFAFEKGDTFRPTSKGLYPKQDKKQEQMLAEWVEGFEAEEMINGEKGEKGDNTDVIDAMPGKKIGEVFVKDGKLYINAIGAAQPLDVNANKVKGHTKVECFEAYSAIKEALAEVLAYQTENESDEGLQALLDNLNKAYDDFVATYGHFNKNTAIAFLRNDVEYANVFALEKFEEVGDAQGNKVQKFGKTDVFSKRVVEKEAEPMPTNVKDGIIASIFKFGRVDVPYIAEHLNKSAEEVKQEIIESGYGFEDPATRQIEVSYLYLSGNVREKLRQAQENNENGEYDGNIKALQEVVPMDIPAHLIDFTLGSSWIEPKLYEDYVKERTEVGVQFTAVGGTWFMNEPYFTNYEKNRAMGVTSEMLGRTVMGHTLIEAAIQNRSITVSTTKKNWDGSTETITDKEATQACAAKIDEIRQDFKEWARQKMQSDAEMSERMERIYNDTFNNYVPMSIPDEFVPEYFGGASHKFKMHPHQGRAIVRGTMQPLLLAHEVGTGKTFTLISTAMEMRRLGTARKPMIVVQNATVGQFVASAKELYPKAKILTLEEADRSAEGRKNFYAKIRYNDWDMIVVPQSTFEFIPDSEERQMAFVQAKIEEKMLVLEKMKEADPDGKSMITRQAEREIAALEEELAGLSSETGKKRTAADEKKRAVALQNAEVKAMEMLDRRTDDVENFDDMGIDALLIDEAHEYKHLGFATAMQRGVKGVDPSYSKKSQGVFLKTQAVLEKNNGRNVIFATGTPISNTAAEIWTFMRYLMPADTMEEYGIYYFDDFVRNFGNIQQMLEFTTSGKFKENNRFAGYVNLPELVRIWSGVSDTVLSKEAGDVSDKIPEMESGKAQDLYLPQTRALRSIMKYVKAQLEEYDKMSGKEKKDNSHIPLTMYGIAKAAAVDARLVQSDAEDDTNSKTNEAVRQTLRSLQETAEYKGTVAIFADNYQNKESGFNLYEDIRSKLIAEGVPANEIVVMKSGMTVKKKLEIFEKVNRGEVRVILGSTFTLGTGVNIQERLHTLIHLDAPNRPMDYTQRNGRILRQGNLHKAMGKPVRVLRFGVEDSLDVTAYQRLKTKGAIADSIMNGKQMMANSMTNRVLEEEEDVFGDTVAQLSGSEYAMLKNNAEKNVRKYASRKKQWEADQTYIHNAKPRVKTFIKDAEKRIEDNSRYLEAVRSSFPDGKFKEIVIGKHRFASIEAMEGYFKEYNKNVLAEMKQMKEGEIAGEQERELTIQVGDFSFVVTTKLTRQTVRDGATLFNDVERKMHYSCPELGIEDIPVRQNLLRNAIEDITKNVITGRDFAERLEAAERSRKHNEAELEQLLSREGKPFEYEAELEHAKAQYEEYAELMKKELEEKEAKYAEMDATVETADNLANAEEEDDDDVLYRIYDTIEEVNEQFNEDLQEQVNGTLPQGHIYQLGLPGNILRSCGFPNMPIELSSTRLAEKASQGNHIFDISEVKDLVKELNNPWAVFRYGNKAKNVIVGIEHNGKQFLVGVHFNQSHRGMEVSDIRGIFPKDNAEWLNWITQGKADYLNKEKIQTLIDKQRINLAEVEYLNLDSVAKIVKEFDNPVIEDNFSAHNDAIKNRIEALFNQAISGEFKGKPISIGRLTDAGKAYLEQISGVAFRANVDFVLNPSDLMHIYKDHFGNNEKDKGQNIPLDIEDIRSLADVISSPDKVIFFKEGEGSNRNMFYFFKEAEDGTYNLMEIYSDRKGNLTAKTFYKTRKDATQRVMDIERSLLPTSETYSGAILSDAKIPQMFESTSIEDDFSARDGEGAYTDDEVSFENDPISKVLGKPRFTRKQRREFAERERQRMAERVEKLAKKLHLDNVEVVTEITNESGKIQLVKRDVSGRNTPPALGVTSPTLVEELTTPREQSKAKAKGYYSKRTGKITIVIPNHSSVFDVEQTLLHEAVAHYGLRQLFGEHFETFLDNVFNNADEAIRQRIVALAAKNGWDFIDDTILAALGGKITSDIPPSLAQKVHKATEEYLASLAEQTNFDALEHDLSWWSKIKRLFLNMLEKIGFEGFTGVTLSDNELRYLLWRSYENLTEPGRHRSILGEAADVAKQYELGVGNYSVEPTAAGQVAEAKLTIGEKTVKNVIVDMDTAPKSRKDAIELLSTMQQPFHNADQDADIYVSNRDARHSMQFRNDAQIHVFGALPKIIESAVKIGNVEVAEEEKNTTKSVSIYYCPINVDGVQYSGRMVVKEYYNGTHVLDELHLYNILLKEATPDAQNASSQGIPVHPSSVDEYKVKELIHNSQEQDKELLGINETTLFRDGDPKMEEKRLARHIYEQRVKSGMYQSQEALQDSMLGLKEAMQAIIGTDKYIEDVDGFENAYIGENRLSSVNKAEADAFARLVFKPMLDEVAKLSNSESEREELTDYMMAKHGLERNEYMRKQAEANDEDSDRDFAGLTALTGMENVADAEAEAQRMVDEYEQAHDTTDLWERVNAVSKAILQKSLECGMMSKEIFEKVLNMYEFYIPLRGFDEKTSADAYAYLPQKHSAFNAPIKKAKGRTSKADDPIANMALMAEGAIMQGNRNKLVKQRFLNFVLNHPSDLVSVSDLWIAYDALTGEWKPVFPDNIESTDTPEEVEQKMQEFEAKMESLSQEYPDAYKKSKDAIGIPYRVVESRDMRHHQVIVRRNGRDVVLTINGNPRAAQALNGQTNPDNDMSGAIGAILRAGEKINRQLSAFYTTRNPDFIVSNFMRDMLYTNTMVWIKESRNYAIRFHLNYGKVNPVKMKMLLAKYRQERLNMSDKIEAMFHQFMMNGGETGYANIRDIERHKSDIKRELKKSRGRIPVAEAWDYLGERFDELNRAVENCARFAAFITSREIGRSIDRSIYDAKEISVNFNKKGGGAKFYGSTGQTLSGNASALVSGLGRSGYVFWNAGVQGMTNFGRQVKRHPAKALTGVATLFLLGALTAYLGYNDDDDDEDKNAYFNLPEYVRRSNILFRAGDSWVSIPLPIEYRAMYGMGELMVSVLSGKEHLTGGELASEMLSQMTQILPLDFMEGGGGVNAFVPSSMKPLW